MSLMNHHLSDCTDNRWQHLRWMKHALPELSDILKRFHALYGDGVSLKTPRPRGWVGAGRPSGCKSSFNKRNMYQYPHVSQLFILLPWQSRVYPEPLKVVEFVQLTTECCWGQPSDPCQRGCLTSHACVMWGPRTLNADDDDDDDDI